MSAANLEVALYIFVLASFLGFEVIRRVPHLLHTPLMSLTNAISGIALVGSLAIAGAHRTTLSTVLGTLAVIASTINVVGGFLLTDRMLRMFRLRDRRPAAAPAAPTGAGARFAGLPVIRRLVRAASGERVEGGDRRPRGPSGPES